MFCTYVHIYSSPLHQTQSVTQSLKSNQDYTFHSVFLFSLPILFKVLYVWHTYLEHQMIFDCSVAEDAEGFVSQHVDCFVIGDAEGSVAVDIGDSMAEGFVQSGAEGFGSTFWVDFVGHHPSPLLCALLHFCKWDNVVPMSIFCGLFGHCHGMGDCCNLGLFFCFDGGGWCGTGVGGIGQSFLVSNRFSNA